MIQLKALTKDKRKKGEGMIRERKPGVWEARIIFNGNVKSFYGKTEREAAKKLKDYKTKIILGASDQKKISYENFLENWLERKKLQLKPQSFSRLDSTIRNHIIDSKSGIGFYDLDKIDAEIIQNLIDIKSKKISFSSTKKIYDALNESMRFARSSGRIAQNPVDLVVLPTQGSRIYKKKNSDVNNLEIFTEDEIKRFVEVVNIKYQNSSPVFNNGRIFLLMLNTGLRVGEVGALKWTDFDGVNHTIKVNKTIIKDKDENGKTIFIEQDSAKTKGSERVLKLNANALKSIPDTRKGDYIYCSKSGKLLLPGNIQHMLDRVLIKAKISHKSTHVFRHTYASRLFEKGVDVKVVSELLGHSSVQTTYNTYITLIKSQKAKAMEAIEDLY